MLAMLRKQLNGRSLSSISLLTTQNQDGGDAIACHGGEGEGEGVGFTWMELRPQEAVRLRRISNIKINFIFFFLLKLFDAKINSL